MVNNFFNSIQYITLLEESAINGNGSALFKMRSKTLLLLGERQGILRKELPPLGIYDKIVNEACEVIKETGCAIEDAFIAIGRTRHGIYPSLSHNQIEKLHQTRRDFGKNKYKKHLYTNL